MTNLTPAAMPTIPLIVHDGQVFTTSRDIAEFFGKAAHGMRRWF